MVRAEPRGRGHRVPGRGRRRGVGVAAMSFFRTALDGAVTRLAIPVNVATDPATAGRGSSRRSSGRTRRPPPRPALRSRSRSRTAPPTRSSCTGSVVDLPRLRLWARPLRAGAVIRYALGRPGSRAGLAPGRCGADAARASRCVRLSVRPGLDELGRHAAPPSREPLRPRRRVLRWRYLDSPATTAAAGVSRRRLRGVAVVGHTFKHGVSAGFLADP